MTNKTSINALALILISTIGLAGCGQQETSTADVSDLEEQEMVEKEDQNESEVEEQDETAGEEISEESEEEINEDEIESTIFGNQEDFVYISADRLSVRANSSEESETLGSLARGNEVKVLEEIESEETTWFKINYQNSENNEGWISSEFTVADINELHSSPMIFEDEEMNEYFTSPTLFEDNTVVAYYGHPNSEVMGIVGRHPIPDLISLLNETTDSYDAVDDSKGAIPAIYLVYGTVQPGGEIYKMDYDLVMSYIEAAYQSGVLVYIDHQIGKHAPTFAINEIVSFMRYPNVHLALDPEWRTDRPMQEVGHLTGTEINGIQESMRDYIVSNEIQGTKQFVFHQFIEKMIRESGDITSDYDPVLLVHNTSGWGSPDGKRTTHDRNAETTNIPYKGFKLWYHFSDQAGVHYDDPLMTPEQVLDLDPQPGLVIYQ
ncbi:SH3 domain-containing protein [Alkalibacterium sp. f15]|uniref:SH3 domain-containing protein n=1 Tax=Alkalibacterium sp. f15 TaxID=3414029 RepID=UPI003BF8FFB7